MTLNHLEIKDCYREKSILITGGLGFLGSNLAYALYRFGARVTLLDSLDPRCGGNLFNIRGLEEKLGVNICDIRDGAALAHLVKGRDIIFHVAGLSGRLESLEDPPSYHEINLGGTLALLEACRRRNPGARIVYGGCRRVYGNCRGSPIDELRPVQPLDFCSLSKAAAEGSLMLYHRHFGVPVVMLRLTSTYGPRHRMRDGQAGTLLQFVRRALEGVSITVYGDGTQVRDFTYVDDVTEAFLLAGVRDEAVGEVFNIGSGEPVSILEAAKAVIQAADTGSYDLAPWPEDLARIETGDYVADFEKIRGVLGWEPKTSLLLGLQKTMEYYGRYRAHYW
jgi:nucleoside-diphosphate-sugar epimerase